MVRDSLDLEGGVRELDGVLPEEIDRRKFLIGATASMLAGLAGCTGGDSDSDGNGDGSGTGDGGDTESTPASSGEQSIIRNVIYRNAYLAEPDYSPSFAAVHEGFWEGRNISPPNVRQGFGSPDTVQRVGTRSRQTQLGNAALGSVVAGVSEGLDVSIFGTHTALPSLLLVWRKDMMDSADDLAGKTVLVDGSYPQQLWPAYRDTVGVDADDVNVQLVDASVSPALLNQGEGAALLGGGIDKIQIFRDTVEAEIGIEPFYHRMKIIGYPHIVNSGWLDESGNREYTQKVLGGLSHAGKWVFLNPERAVEMMQTLVNPNLQTTETARLVEQIKAGFIATNLTEATRDQGLCYLDEEATENSITRIGTALGASNLPSLSEVALIDLNHEADLATFTSSEWSQVEEASQPYADILLG